MCPDKFKQAKYLIVDDEPNNILVLESLLEEWECSDVRSTTNPYEVLPLFLEFQPDIVLLDLMMPGLDGFQVIEQLQPLIPEEEFLPILVLTADNTEITKNRALGVGATDFLTKPFDIVELALRITNLIRTRFLYTQLANQNKVLDEKVRERTQELAQSEIETIECLAAAAEFRDDDTGQHTQRVGHTTGLLAQHMGLDTERVDLIRRAAPLHDVGKIGISDLILLKPGKLTPEEFHTMKSHAVIGSQILSRHHTPMLQMAARIALTHHERWDGGGYPQGLRGSDIPLEGRLVAVADVFDALTNERPYKKAWPVAEAAQEIQRQSGTQFDPQVVESFLRIQAEGELV